MTFLLLMGRGSDGFTGIADLIPGTVMDLDATITESYSGSGQTWTNLSGDTDYDFNLGDTSSPSSNDPVFTGSPGTREAYFAFDGTQFFTLPAITPLLASLHRTTGGSGFWCAFSYRHITVASGTNPTIFTTRQFANRGVTIRTTGSLNRIQLTQRGETGETSTMPAGDLPDLVDGADYIVILSVPEGGGTARFYFNGAAGIDQTITYDASSQDATDLPRIGNGYASVTFFPNGTRLRGFSLGQGTLTDQQAALLFNLYVQRHVVSFPTPSALLLESGFYLLFEDGGKLLLE